MGSYNARSKSRRFRIYCCSIRTRFPDIPIIATGGNRPETITATIEAGANAITYTPPTAQELFKTMMSKYREE